MSAIQPIFIIGANRSGTTLLRLMLTTHSEICIPPESPFFVKLEPKYGKSINLCEKIEDFLNDLYTDEKFREWNIDRVILKNNLSAQDSLSYVRAVSLVYQTYMQMIQPGSHRWGDKNPIYLYHTDTILKHFPHAKIIHIVRDIRGIYNSLCDLESRGARNNSKSKLFLVTERWAQVVHLIEKYERNKEQFYTIYYEKLVSHPQEELKNLCSWLDLEFSSSMLGFYQKNKEKNLVPSNRISWHQMTLKSVSEERVYAWMDKLSVSEVEAIEILNGGKMKKLGYHCVTKPWRYRGLIKLLGEYIKSKTQIKQLKLRSYWKI